MNAPAKPPHPKLVLALAILAPGAGHFLLGRYNRGLGFAVFSLIFAALTWRFCPPDRSLIGHTAGGLFVWALSIPDAYATATLRRAIWARTQAGSAPSDDRAGQAASATS